MLTLLITKYQVTASLEDILKSVTSSAPKCCALCLLAKKGSAEDSYLNSSEVSRATVKKLLFPDWSLTLCISTPSFANVVPAVLENTEAAILKSRSNIWLAVGIPPIFFINAYGIIIS